MTTSSAVHGRPVPRLVRLLNPLIGRLLGAGLPFGPNVLLTVRGRKSGLPRTFPVAVLEHRGRRFVQSPFGEVDWVRNLRADGTASLTKGRRREAVTAVELAPEDAAPILHAALAPQLRSGLGAASVARYYELPADDDTAGYVELARRHPTFELLAADRSDGRDGPA